MKKIKYIRQKEIEKDCDILWALCVKARANWKSEISLYNEEIVAHHLVKKPSYVLRYLLENGVCCTKEEHEFGFHNRNREKYYKEKICILRGKDIYKELEKYKQLPPKIIDLRIVKLYLKKELKKYIRFNGFSRASNYNQLLIKKYLPNFYNGYKD